MSANPGPIGEMLPDRLPEGLIRYVPTPCYQRALHPAGFFSGAPMTSRLGIRIASRDRRERPLRLACNSPTWTSSPKLQRFSLNKARTTCGENEHAHHVLIKLSLRFPIAVVETNAIYLSTFQWQPRLKWDTPGNIQSQLPVATTAEVFWILVEKRSEIPPRLI